MGGGSLDPLKITSLKRKQLDPPPPGNSETSLEHLKRIVIFEIIEPRHVISNNVVF